MIGSSHKICQDAKRVRKLSNGIVVATVADGVGSCKYADVAAKIAVYTSVAFCEKKLRKKPNDCDFLELIEEAFNCAEQTIEQRAINDKQPLSEYDTTLDLVIYDGKRVTYGHCGDGGIIGLTTEGDYVEVTTPQKKDGIFVIPLREGSKNKNNTWVFDCVEGDFASVLLATDGVYDIFFPYLLKGQPTEVYVPLIRYFMDNNILKVSRKTIKVIEKKRMEYLNSKTCVSITDDKTLLVLINEKVVPKLKENSFYEEPDWNTLQLEWNKKAYPYMYEKKIAKIETKNNDSEQSMYRKTD
jgi:serine/threonine protein phosphatase PrpC